MIGPRPSNKGWVSVSDGHRLYYELVGDKKGIPVVFLHGGPGSGFVESHKKPFDFRKFRVLFFDQRGAGRSKPFASLKNNTTWKLVKDINFLMDKFGIGKALFYGGSWGSTLALVYAITHPERVQGLVLRGIYLSTKAGLKHYLGGGGAADYVPEAWERFSGMVPPRHRKDIMGYYLRRLKSKDKKTRLKFAYEWSLYELSMVSMKPSKEKIKAALSDYSFASLAPLEAHYLSQNCFLPDNFILKNASKLSSIPTSIVHGRYDLLCRPSEAYALHKKIKGSRLDLVIGGHSASDGDIKKALRRGLSWTAKKIKKG